MRLFEFWGQSWAIYKLTWELWLDFWLEGLISILLIPVIYFACVYGKEFIQKYVGGK